MTTGRSEFVRGVRLAVDRDGMRRHSSDEQRQLELCQIMWSMRHLAIGAALVVGLARHGHGFGFDERLTATAWALGLAGHLLVRRNRRFDRAVAIGDGVVLVVLAVLGLPPFLVLVTSVAILGWAATFRPVAAVASAAVVLTAVGATFVRRGDEVTPATGLGAFGLLGCIFVVRTVRMNMGARRAADREQLVEQAIDAILWETLPDDPSAMKVSAAAERVLGHPAAAWSTPGFLSSIVHPDDRAEFERHLAEAEDGSITVRVRDRDGAHRWMEHRATWVTERSARHRFAAGVLLDRTEQVEAEREALAFGHLVSTSPIGQVLLRCTPDGPLVEAMNRACQEILSTDVGAVGRPLRELGPEGSEIDRLLALVPVDAEVDTIEFRGAGGRIHQATLRRVDQRSCSIDFLDVTERVESGARLHAQARQDELTGLPNRRAFLETLEQHLAAPVRSVGAVVIIDLDEFKDINDSLGHETGDQLLREIGRRMVDHTGPDDMVARLGGDEFAALFAAGQLCPAERAALLVGAINEPVLVGDLRLRVRASAGVVPVPSQADEACGQATTAELVRCADVAMYLAKAHGTGVEIYDRSSDRFDRERLELVTELETAVADDQLVLHHQPLYDVATRRIVGTEALARWNHPVLGLVPPDAFIGLAEVSGQMKLLTRWVVRRALADLVALGDAGADLEVSVNLSVRNLYEVDLVEWIAMTLDAFGVEPRRLIVEITESTVMDDQSVAVEVIHGLRELGVRTWIDDFGTGHSSLARLRSLPVDGVKIDRSFVSDTPSSSSDRIVLRSLVELVGSLGLHTVAEGVEDLGTMALLREFGCTTAQGYALARPLTFDALRALVTAEAGRPVLAASSR